ncbi:hypothetical protein MLD38_038948 [Melastoma candidum]|uniref:Uncharacterized protein n=1 Tax=Melastoma candidum TaxID=119954 RepID=A0ACB9L1K6_9MYRT|nr:hypothetical protein MLD38_038948 [Melastoma candidum]
MVLLQFMAKELLETRKEDQVADFGIDINTVRKSRQISRLEMHQLMQENLQRGIYACGFEKPSAIQQRGIVSFCKGLDVIQQAQSGTGKTDTFRSGILQQLDYSLVQCQALVLAPTESTHTMVE